MYVEGTTDLMGMIMYLPFQPADTKEKNLALIIERVTTRYFPVYEKVSDKSPVVHKDSKVGYRFPPLHSPVPTHQLSRRQVTVQLWNRMMELALSNVKRGPQNNIRLVSVLSIFAVFLMTPHRADPTF